jgi:transcriptional regulator with XRE-family HTH domain
MLKVSPAAPREVVMTLKRVQLAARRKAVGFSQDQLAEQLGVDRSTIARWESGVTEPQPWMRPRLARVLAVSVEQLGKLLAEASTTTGEGDTERLDYTLTHPGSADVVTVAQLRREVQQLDEQYVLMPSSSLLADAGQALGQVRFLAANTANLRVRRELYAVEAEAATLMGQLVWDASQRRDHASARLYYDQAIEAAQNVRDPAAEGLALLRRAMIALYGERDPNSGLLLAEQAAETTRHASNVLTGLAMLHTAEAHAMLGNRLACEQALAAADSILGHMDDMDAAIGTYSVTQLGRMAGSCYLSLEDTKRAIVLLEDTAVAYDKPSKSQAIVLGNLSLALIRQGSLDEAAGRLHEAMDVIERNWGGGGLNLIFGADRELRPWRSVPVVQDVLDRLLTLMAG